MTHPPSIPRLLVPAILVCAAAIGCDTGSDGERDAATTGAGRTDTAQRGPPADSGAPSPGSTSAASRPDYAALRDRECDTLTNSFDCARAIERSQLRTGGPAIRHGDTLRLPLASGDTARFVDQPGDHAQVELYSFQDVWPDAGFFVVQKQYYEGSEFLLVDDSTGERFRMPDWPLRSPDGRRFAVLSLDLVAGYGPNTLQVWSIGEDGKPGREWETQPSQWGPASGSWQDSVTLRFTQHGYCSELGGEGRSMCDRPATLRREAGTWHVEPGELRGGG